MRAIAVVGVIAFHFKLGVLRAGGFAGVDVFFVISGFLMTQIIGDRLDRSRFSLWDFLLARVRRIVPAFVVLVVAVLVAGLVLLNPPQYQAVAERSAWTLPFASNILFARQGSYFVSPDQNWLLHTWSLSVEAQFYLVFPIILMLSRSLRAPRAIEAMALLVIASLSFAIMIWSLSAGGDSRSYNFYMLWSRAWEFLVGVLCVYALPLVALGARQRIAVHYLGMSAIFLAMVSFHNTTPWPSPPTALPVLGSAAMLIAGHQDPAWARITPVRQAGVWSYSLYLWHWPIAAAASFFGYWSLPFRLAGVVASVLLGMASYLLVERAATDYLWRESRRIWRLGIPTFVFSLAFAIVATKSNGLEAARYVFRPALLSKLTDFRTAENDWLSDGACENVTHPFAFIDECKFGNLTSNDVLVMGDSFAAQLRPRYKDISEDSQVGITFVTRAGCVPISKSTEVTFDAACDRWTEEAYPYVIDSDFRRVVFLAYWPVYAQGRLCLLTEPNCGSGLDPRTYGAALDAGYRRMAELWRILKSKGKEVIVFDVPPYAGPAGDPRVLYDEVAAGKPLASFEISLEAFMETHREATRRLTEAADYAGVTLVNPAVSLCPEGKCPIVRNGRPLYMDAIHFRASMMKDPRFAVFDRYTIPGETLRPPIN